MASEIRRAAPRKAAPGGMFKSLGSDTTDSTPLQPKQDQARDLAAAVTAPISKIESVAASRVEPIPLDRIKDGGAQMRVEMRPETINDYASDMLDGAVFPPITVFSDGNDFWLADGFHRVEATRKIGRETILAEIKEGSARDAVLHGVGSNAVHGLRRTQADKQRAVERLLKDPEWQRWSDRKIAEVAKVDHKTVGAIRRKLNGEFPTTTPKAKANGGEFPTEYTKPTNRDSLIEDVLRTIADHALIAECRRRGLRVEADDV